MLGEGQTSLFLGPVWWLELGTPRGDAATNLERETQDVCERRNGPVVVIGRPHGVTAERQCRRRGESVWGVVGCGRGVMRALGHPSIHWEAHNIIALSPT